MMSVMIDVAIAFVALVCLYLGWRRGLLRSLTELLVVVLALALAGQIASVAATSIIDNTLRPATHAAIDTKVEEMVSENTAALSPTDQLEELLEGIPFLFVREQAQKALDALIAAGQTFTGSTQDTLTDAGYQVVDQVLDSVVYNLLHALLYLVAFLLLTVVLRLAARLLDQVFKLPVLHSANHLGGLAFGLAKGVLLVGLGVWVLVQTGVATSDVIDQSYLLKPVVSALDFLVKDLAVSA
jgi:uncharacterized membrane protein required for colicin V production